MKTFEKVTIGRTRDRDSGSVFTDFEFRRCEFDDCEISLAARPCQAPLKLTPQAPLKLTPRVGRCRCSPGGYLPSVGGVQSPDFRFSRMR